MLVKEYATCIKCNEMLRPVLVPSYLPGKIGIQLPARGMFISFHRSLVTALHSAKMLSLDHITSPKLASYKTSARVFYVEGYVLSHRSDAALHLAEFASTSGKVSRLMRHT